MSKFKIHQLLHGYRHGHELLASSLRLEKKALEIVRRLSDLSGMLPNKLQIPPYFCGYHLEDTQFYVFSQTWLDESSSRAGCVFTHSLLVPSDLWISTSPRTFISKFRKPDKDFIPYTKAMDWEQKFFLPPGSNPLLDSQIFDEFVRKYFVDGVKPIVWFDTGAPEIICWSIVESLWPSLRRRFGFCTFSLQPRGESESIFDIYFAPVNVSSRFQKLPNVNILPSIGSDNSHPWIATWRNHVLNRSNLSVDEMELIAVLNDSPTELPKVFLFSEILSDPNSTFFGMLGALDLLDSIGTQSNQCIRQKNLVFERLCLLLPQLSETSVEEKFQMIRLIDMRLSKPAFQEIDNRFVDFFALMAKRIIVEDPLKFFKSLEDLNIEEQRAVIMKGYVLAVLDLVSNQAQFIDLLLGMPNIERIVRVYPDLIEPIAQLYFEGESKVKSLYLQCISSTAPLASLHLLKRLLPLLRTPLNLDELKDLLFLVPSDSVAEILTQVSGNEMLFNSCLDSHVFKEFIANHKNESRQWISSSGLISCSLSNKILAHTYERSIADAEKLIEEFSKGAIARETLNEFVNGISLSEEDKSWFAILLGSNRSFFVWMCDEELPYVNDAIFYFLAFNLAAFPFSFQMCFLQKVMKNEKIVDPFVANLAARTVLGLSIRYCEKSEGKLESLVGSEWYQKWLTKSSAAEVLEVFESELNNMSEDLTIIWHWMNTQQRSLMLRRDNLTSDMIDMLIASCRVDWLPEYTKSWCALLQKFLKGDKPHAVRLSSHALQFCFSNLQLPLAEVVMLAFPVVYRALEEEKTEEWTRYTVFLSFLGWDKCKELRRKLVDAFRKSQWPPKYLALSIESPELFVKILKKMRLDWARTDQYLDIMKEQLEKEGSTESKAKARLVDKVRNDVSSEDWY